MSIVDLSVGRERWSIECEASRVLPLRHHTAHPSPLADPRSAVAAALERPIRYEALRRTLTPDDRVVIVVDERLPRLVELLAGVLDHLLSAGIALGAVTILTPPESRQNWLDDLPDEFEEIHIERHAPDDPTKLGYVATTQSGRRVYLNRTLVEADATVVLSGRSYDPLHGYGGSEGFLYPLFSDTETRKHYAEQRTLNPPGKKVWAPHQEAIEVAWLLGEPFMVQVIEASDDGIAHVIAGRTEASRDGQILLDTYWRATVEESAEIVIATLTGDPARHEFLDLARAAAAAARVVEPEGRIVLLSQATPHLGVGATMLQRSGSLRQAMRRLIAEAPLDLDAAFLWASAANKARIFLASALEESVVESLSAAAITNAKQVQRVIAGDGKCLFLPDAHKMLVTMDA